MLLRTHLRHREKDVLEIRVIVTDQHMSAINNLLYPSKRVTLHHTSMIVTTEIYGGFVAYGYIHIPWLKFFFSTQRCISCCLNLPDHGVTDCAVTAIDGRCSNSTTV